MIHRHLSALGLWLGRVAVNRHLSAVKLEVVVVGVEEDDQHVALAAEKYFLVTITVTISLLHT